MKSIVALAIAGLAASSATAAVNQTTTQTQSFSGIPNFSGEFIFDQFDASNFGNPGDVTLLSVDIVATASISGGLLEVDNDGIEAAVINNAELGASITLSSNSLPLALPGVSPVTQGMFNLAANNGDSGAFDSQFGQGEADYDRLVGANVTDMDNSFFSGALAQLFAGAGTFDIDYNALAIFDFGGIGGVSFAGTPVTVNLDVQVFYTYKVVPAPSSMALLGLGGLVATRRRR